jgi:hypothetical protein
MRAFLPVIFAAMLSLLLFSCKKEKLKSNAASFIVINQAAVTSTLSGMADSHKITDIWVYVDDQFQGIYPIGSVMPVMNKGTATVRMYGGIVNNGIAGTRLPYTFYNPYIYNGTFEAGKTYTITPTFQYRNSIKIQDDPFDSSGSYYMYGGDITPTPTSDPAKVWGGSGNSLFMTVTDAKPQAYIKTSTPVALPVGGTEVYLEMDYKCNHEITVGVIGADVEQRTALTLRPSAEWNKVYVSLTTVVSTQPSYTSYRVIIQAIKQPGSPNAEIYLDNLRLVRP